MHIKCLFFGMLGIVTLGFLLPTTTFAHKMWFGPNDGLPHRPNGELYLNHDFAHLFDANPTWDPKIAARVAADADFDRLTALQGKIEAGGKQLGIEMSYDVGSKDSIVTERFGKELSIFYRNGDAVEMVHFCNAGNQPRLRLKNVREPDVLDFEMFAITNLSTPDTPHVQEIIYKLLDANTMELEIVLWPKTRESEKYKLHRSGDNT